MPSADVVVIGQGLAGMAAALSAAQAGARVQVLAKGHAGLYWGAGGLDVAALPGASTPREGLGQLSAMPGHPYSWLADDVEGSLEWLRRTLAARGLAFEGGLDTTLARVPTAIGGTRLAAILPASQAAAARPWGEAETLVVCGIAGFKDFWPAAIAASLARPRVWGGEAALRPERVVAATVELPGVAGRHNLNAPILARRCDDRKWRAAAFDAIAAAVDRAARGGAMNGEVRVALPALIGFEDHAAAWDELRRRLPGAPFEVPLVPPSVPGMRLHRALRAALLAAGGRISTGEEIAEVERDGPGIVSVAAHAAAREFRVRSGHVVLATGGIAGGGIVAQDGALREVVLGLPVQAPPAGEWLAADPFDPRGHPLETAGVRTDGDLRPLDDAGCPVLENVRVVGALLAGQRAVAQGCRSGLSFASGRRAGLLAAAATDPAATDPAATEVRS